MTNLALSTQQKILVAEIRAELNGFLAEDSHPANERQWILQAVESLPSVINHVRGYEKDFSIAEAYEQLRQSPHARVILEKEDTTGSEVKNKRPDGFDSWSPRQKMEYHRSQNQ